MGKRRKECVLEVLIFAGKALIILVCLAALIILIATLVARTQMGSNMEVTPVHEELRNTRWSLMSYLGSKKDLKQEQKLQKKEEKRTDTGVKHRVFLLRFDGDIKASQVDSLRQEITAILQVATPQDEVVAVVESPGGMVTTYGLAASQLARLRKAQIPLVVCVDKVAASGGYMMAVVASRILAAPFAIVGSIGVVAQVPNFNRVLKKYDVDFKEYTAGEYKRTVSLLGEITPKGEEKFREQLEQTHILFKGFVQQFRPQIDMMKVATGEYWYGQQALDLGLVDELLTSDDYLLEKYKNKAQIFEISFEKKQSLSEKISGALGAVISRTLVLSLRKTAEELYRAKTP